MKHINELIGILEGAIFDDIINSNEVDCIKKWVDKNRNLTNDTLHIELIEMIDNAIDESKLSDDTKSSIYAICKKILSETTDAHAKTYELNGIIKGIICDGKIHDIEFEQLRKWIDSYGYIVKEYTLGEKLCNEIEDIIKQNSFAKIDQAEVIKYFDKIIKNIAFEEKLDYLCKLTEERKIIGVELIDILDNETAIKEIHSRAERKLIQMMNSYSGYCAKSEIIIISLTLIAMLAYNGNFYDSVRETYQTLYSKYTEQKVEGMIRDVLSNYKHNSESNSRGRRINTVLENSIVPQPFLHGFFDFIYDIYKLNFEYSLPDDLQEDFAFVFDWLKKSIQTTGDDISINVTKKTYKLIATTKQLINRTDGTEALIRLSIIIVRLIDKRFWNRNIKISNPYLKKGYESWEKSIKDPNLAWSENKRTKQGLRSKWEAKFILMDDSVHLITPIHRIKADYDYRELAIVVMNGNEELYRNNTCDIREIIGGYQINTNNIEINKPLGKVTYKLMEGSRIIYDSGDKLYRDCIVFKDDNQEFKQEIKNNTDYEGKIIIAYQDSNSDCKMICKKEYFSLGYQLVKFGDVIQIGDTLFNFSSMNEPGIFGDKYLNCYVRQDKQNKLLPVYSGICYVMFEVDNSSNKFEIFINGKIYRLKDLEFRTIEKLGRTQYVIKLEIHKSDIYRIEVNQLLPEKVECVLKKEFVYDTLLEYSSDLINRSQYKVNFKSHLANKNFEIMVDSSNFRLDFIQFDLHGNKYCYLIPFEFKFYQIDNEKWHFVDEDIWVDDINENTVLNIYNTQFDSVFILTDVGKMKDDEIRIINKDFYKQLKIHFLITYSDLYNFVSLIFTENGKPKFLIRIYNRCVIDSELTQIQCVDYPKKIAVTPVYCGKNKIYYEIKNKSGEKIYKSKLLESGETDFLSEFESFKEYTLIFFEKTKKLQLKPRPLYEVNKTFYAREDLIGKVFKISDIYIHKTIRGAFTEKHYETNNYYLKILKLLDLKEGIFEGEIYRKYSTGNYYLSNINPVEIELCSGIINDSVEIYMANEGDGLLFDYEHRGVLNAMDSQTASDIFMYTVVLEDNLE